MSQPGKTPNPYPYANSVGNRVPTWLRYGIAIACVACLAGIRTLLSHSLGPFHPFLLLLLAVMISSWVGGLGPGLLATALGASLGIYLFGASQKFPYDSPDDYLGAILFLISGIVISSLNEARSSAQRRTEISLRELHDKNEQLKQETTERMRQEKVLKETQLKMFESQKMESIGRLAGGIAHDFNNLLTAILCYSELIELSVAPESKEQDYIQKIQMAGERAADLTSQLLIYARRQASSPTSVNLMELIQSSEMMIRRMLRENIDYTATPAKDTWNIKTDSGQIQQVLLNLLINARDAMPDGGTLAVEVRNVSLNHSYQVENEIVVPGDYVMLTVSDSGMGMTDKVKKHIYEPFYTTKEVGKGTGLGLAACYSTIRQAGGYISVESAPGRGATFKIYFPRDYSVSNALNPGIDGAQSPAGREVNLIHNEKKFI